LLDKCDKTSAQMLSDLRTRDFHSPRSLFTARIPVSDDEKAGNMKAAGAVAGASFLKIPRMIKGRPCDAATVANHGHGMRGGSWALLFFCPGESSSFFPCVGVCVY
jgi:hypothetical protein